MRVVDYTSVKTSDYYYKFLKIDNKVSEKGLDSGQDQFILSK